MPRKKWRMIKEVLQQPTKTIPLKIVNQDGEIPKCADDVSEVFRNYFSAAGKRVAEGIYPMLYDPNIFDYLVILNPRFHHDLILDLRYLAPVSLCEMKQVRYNIKIYARPLLLRATAKLYFLILALIRVDTCFKGFSTIIGLF